MVDFNESIIVIGGGTIGLSTALHLARRGYNNVTVLDKFPIPSPISAGNDTNKIFESCYADSVMDTVAKASLCGWKTDPVFQPYFHETGILYASNQDLDWQDELQYQSKNILNEDFLKKNIQSNDGLIFLHNSDDYRQIMPLLTGPMTGWRGFMKAKGCGWVSARNSLISTYEAAKELGVKFITQEAGTVTSFVFKTDCESSNSNETTSTSINNSIDTNTNDIVGVRVEDGTIYSANKYILAAGANSDLLLDFHLQLCAKCWTLAHICLTSEEVECLKQYQQLQIRQLHNHMIFNNELKDTNQQPCDMSMNGMDDIDTKLKSSSVPSLPSLPSLSSSSQSSLPSSSSSSQSSSSSPQSSSSSPQSSSSSPQSSLPSSSSSLQSSSSSQSSASSSSSQSSSLSFPVVLHLSQGFFFPPNENNEIKICNEFPGYVNLVHTNSEDDDDDDDDDCKSVPIERQGIPEEAECAMRLLLQDAFTPIESPSPPIEEAVTSKCFLSDETTSTLPPIITTTINTATHATSATDTTTITTATTNDAIGTSTGTTTTTSAATCSSPPSVMIDSSIRSKDIHGSNDSNQNSFIIKAATDILADLAKKPFVMSRICWCTDTPDRHYLICKHPGYSSLIIATGDSGHAFKTLPIIGSYVVDLLQNVLDVDMEYKWRWRPETATNRQWQSSQGRLGGLTGAVTDLALISDSKWSYCMTSSNNT